MRGHAARTPENVALVQRMRAEGKMWREIAAEFGLSIKTVHEWGTDPDAGKRSARKASYAGTCVDCGAPTDGTNGPDKASERCRACFPAWWRERFGIWNRERVIAAIQTWADEHGGIPPSAIDWNPGQARSLGHPERAEKFQADGAWPYSNTVRHYFGRWNAAIEAAGFEPRRSGCYGREGEDPAVLAETVELYRSGLSTTQIAELQGVHANSVRHRLIRAGEPRRSASAAQRLRRAA